MKKFKKLSIVLAVALVFQMLPLPAAGLAGRLGPVTVSKAAGPALSGTIPNSNITWELTREEAKDGFDLKNSEADRGGRPFKLTLTGEGAMPDYNTTRENRIDQTGNEIHEEDYYGNDYVPTDTVSTAPWGRYAQYVQTISIDDRITSISDYAFYGCNVAMSANIPSQCKTIGYAAFSSCRSLTEVVMPEGLTDIGSSAFSSCNDAVTITIPDTVKTIGGSAFAYCTAVKSINLPEGVKITGTSAFYRCQALESVIVPKSVGQIPNNTFACCSGLKKAVISEGITSIGQNAFGGDYSGACSSLEEVVLPEKSLETIGEKAFQSASKLASFDVPVSVNSIGINPFYQAGLTEVTVADGNKNYKVQNKMLVQLKDGEAYKVICYPARVKEKAEVPGSVEVIGAYAFASSQVTGADLNMQNKGSVKTLEDYAFNQAGYLAEIELPGSLETIGNYVFTNADSLTSIEVPGKVKTIGESAFQNCDKLKDVQLGDDLQSLGAYVFSYCTKIVELKLPDKITAIGDSAFYNCTGLKEMDFPNSIETIGSGLLNSCISLERVSFGEKVQKMDGGVFFNCPKLKTLTISPGNPNLAAVDNVVYNKDKTELIYFAAGQQTERFIIPDEVKKLGTNAFTYCSCLDEIRFPASVEELASNAIYRNSSITKLLFYGNAPKVNGEYTKTKKYDSKGRPIEWYVYNGSVRENKYENGANDNSQLSIHYTEGSTGWENGWTSAAVNKGSAYYWNEKYSAMTWDPKKTDEAEGDFENGLKWKYRDDIGELTFFCEEEGMTAEIPDFEEDALPGWASEDGRSHREDVKLIQTGPATRVGKNAFNGAANLVKILSKSTLNSVGERAFVNCTKLESVYMPSVSEIEKEAFMGDAAIIRDIDVRGIKDIGEGAFKECSGMVEILLGEKLKKMGKEAFASCLALQTMIIPESVSSLGEGCFSGCSKIRTINIPANVKDMPARCFADCETLEKVYFYGDYPASWEEDCFDGKHAEGLTIYYRAANTSWNKANGEWNGIPVVGQDKFYTEKEDHYSFSNSSSSFGYDSNYYIPRQRYVTALQSVTRGSYYYEWSSRWGGSCFGMAASSEEFYEGDLFDVADYTSSAEDLYDVAAPGSPEAQLTKIIEIYQVSQFADEIGIEISNNFAEYRKLIKQVEEFERSGGLSVDSTADPLVLCVYSGCVGHALVPVTMDMDQEGNYILGVYDCNYPNAFRELKIAKDFKSIDYRSGWYKFTSASFVKYSTIRDVLENADFSGEYLKGKPKARVGAGEDSKKVTIAVNRKDIDLENGGGRDYKEIDGVYEQRPVSIAAQEGSEDGEAKVGEEFSGIRSFVLPQGEYVIRDNLKESGENEEDLKFYTATEDLFSEIQTSDADAELKVKSVKGEGEDSVTIYSDSAETKTDFTIMDTSGIEKEISAVGESVTIEVTNKNDLRIYVPEDSKGEAEVKVDGEEFTVTKDEKETIPFYTAEDDNPLGARDMSANLVLDEENKLSGNIESYVTWGREEAGESVKVTTKIKDEDGNVIARNKSKQSFQTGMQIVNVKFDCADTNIGKLAGKFNAVCEMTIEDSDGNVVVSQLPDIELTATKKQEIIPDDPTPTPNPGNDPTPTPAPGNDPTPTPGSDDDPKGDKEPGNQLETPKPDVPFETQQQTGDISGNSGDNKDSEAVSVPAKGTTATVGALKYKVVKSAGKNGTVEVCGAKKKTAKKVSIPKTVTIDGYSFKVVSIRNKAFAGMKKLTSVTIGANVTKIGKSAFAGCPKLKTITVRSGSIKTVGSKAFKGTAPKVTVKVPKAKKKKYKKLFKNKGKISKKAVFK